MNYNHYRAELCTYCGQVRNTVANHNGVTCCHNCAADNDATRRNMIDGRRLLDGRRLIDGRRAITGRY